ncbi:ArnT family glycosyltransferase [Alishewanella sp. HL-SH06]|uniref:ArnT family glycosyltransferase n=1 Tax=Alishewanella sp. HL-SH06 TaxID=3461144 RepID=UPI004041DA06
MNTLKPTYLPAFLQQAGATSWLLFFVAAVLIFSGMGLRDPWPADEPRFAFIAKEMVETGQWFFPARAEELYPDKPPIFMWTIAFFYWLTGSMRWSFLLPSALAGMLTLVLVYDITKRLWDKKSALVAGWLLLFSLQFLLQAKTAQIDAMVCAWITLGCYGLLRYCLVDGQFKWYALAWFFMGIGVITKGVGFLPVFMLLPYIWYARNTERSQRVVQHPLWTWFTGPVFMLAAISLWFIPMLLLVAQADNNAYEIYRDNILLKQTVTRYADAWHHVKPAWYFITSVIPVFWLPAILTVPWLIKPWLAAVKQYDGRILLPLGYVLLVIAFFSASSGKRGVYILPALPMLVIAIAPYYKELLSKKLLKNSLFVFTLGLSLLFTLLAILGLADVKAVSKLALKIEIEPWYLFLLIGVIGIVTLLLNRSYKWLAWPVFFSVLWLSYSTYGYQLRNNASTPISIYDQVQLQFAARQETQPQIALVNFSEQFFLFSPYAMYHFGAHTPNDQQLMAAYHWQQNEHQYVLIEENLLENSCFDVAQALDVGFAHRRHWMLLPISAKHADCQQAEVELKTYSYKTSASK